MRRLEAGELVHDHDRKGPSALEETGQPHDILAVYNVNISNVSVATTVINGLYRIKPANVGEVNVKVDGVSTVNTVSGVDTAAKLENALTGAGLAGAGNTVIQLSGDIDLSGQNWTPVNVDGYHGADVVTIDGNGATIKGLSAPLFAGGFAGGSGIVIKNLTIADSEIVSANTQGSGAFIECVDSMDIITLSNCHLKNSTVSGSRTGGLIGWTSGYNVQNDGPVNSYVNVLDCTVVNCTVIGRGSVGAIIGHAGANPATYHTIKNCKILDTELIAIDDDLRVGAIVGTANVGEVRIENCTWDAETTMTQYTSEADYNNETNSITNDKAYGRLVLGSTGKFLIDGVPQ